MTCQIITELLGIEIPCQYPAVATASGVCANGHHRGTKQVCQLHRDELQRTPELIFCSRCDLDGKADVPLPLTWSEVTR